MKTEIKFDGNSAMISINPKVYDLANIYSAAYVFLDKAYILLDGDPDSEVIISIKPKNAESIQILAQEFMNELINYGDYKKRAEDSKGIREIILQRALLTNDSPPAADEFDELLQKMDEL